MKRTIKRLFAVTLSVLMLFSTPVGTALLTASAEAETNIASGTWGTCPWTIDANGTLKGVRGSSDVLTANVSSASSPLVFTTDGTKQDTLKLTGTTRTADQWTGAIQYSVSITP